jgi:hypothetical protein
MEEIVRDLLYDTAPASEPQPATGHVVRMDSNLKTKRMFDTRLEGKRKIGRPKLRWGVTVA